MTDFSVPVVDISAYVDPAATDEDRQALRDAGFSDADVFDIADVAGFFNYTNRVAHAVDMMPNPEYHALGR